MPRHAARRAHLSALLLLLVLSIGAARAAEAQHEAPHSYSTTTSSSSSPAAALIALLGSGAALLAAVVLLALCAEAGPESPKTAPLQPSNQPDAHLVAAAAASSPPNGAALPYAVHTIAHQPGSANGQPSRPPAPIPAPAPAPAVQPGAAYAYGQPLFNQAQSAPPPQPASTDLYFARTVGPDGMLAYAAISLAEAEAMMARGEQVFIRPDKEQAGQDIYEAVPNRDDLYSVASRGGNPGGDIYTVPTRKPAAANASSAPAAAETATAAASADGSSSTSPVASRGMVRG